ncbi:hypothetical protein HanPSC8_Chr15g0663121 [Helianthus annuus]|nr:hypothetical protein HanPSC8_Chr15g0663121 [Helianthus annuus]
MIALNGWHLHLVSWKLQSSSTYKQALANIVLKVALTFRPHSQHLQKGCLPLFII